MRRYIRYEVPLNSSLFAAFSECTLVAPHRRLTEVTVNDGMVQ